MSVIRCIHAVKAHLRILFTLVFLPLPVHAFMEFSGATAPQLSLANEPDEVINYQFTVTFRAYCNSGCTGQDYRIALSDNDPGPAQSPSNNVPESFVVTNLQQYATSASFQQGGDSATIPLGNWTPENILATTTNSAVTGTGTLVLSRSALMALGTGNHELRFWVAGEDTYGTRHYDVQEVVINVVVPTQVKISGLDDVLVTTDNSTQRWYRKDMPFCVHVAGATADQRQFAIAFDSKNASGSPFQLESGAGNGITYNLRFRTNSESWRNIFSDGELPQSFTGHIDEECNFGTNSTIRVRVVRGEADAASSGTYQDTMTLTVRAL